MKHEIWSVAAMVVGSACASFAQGQGAFGPLTRASAPTGSLTGTEGTGSPDVWVCSLPSTFYWGQSSGIHAFSVGTTSSNAGNINLDWIQNGTQHPVIGQNMFRYKDGVLEQIGQSWLKHGFCALQNTLPGCGTCSVMTTGCLSHLAPGCADPYVATLNGATNGLGPRSEVNPTTGAFLWPHATGTVGVTTIRSRLQVLDADINPAQNVGARYFVEGQYVHPQDAQADLDNNNASYREIDIANFGFFPQSTLANLGGTVAMKPAIEVWPVLDPNVQLTTVDLTGVGSGRFFVASLAKDNGDGTWNYEYAIFNMNADRAIGSVSIPASDGLTIPSIGFHDVRYHSGEPYDGTDWPGAHSAGAVTWATTPFATNANANALRWGTMYNYRFTANSGPVAGVATLGLFKPGGAGDPATITASIMAPGPAPCPADLNSDGTVDGADLAGILNAFGGSGPADLNGDGTVDGVDLALLLNTFGPCP